jgi:poly(A) polymerase
MTEFSAKWQFQIPANFQRGLLEISSRFDVRIYAAGGSVRDLLLGRRIRDLDLVVDKNPFECARSLAAFIDATFIILDEQEKVARVAGQLTVDFSGFRRQTSNIVEDLRLRDFTINAMAVEIISPQHGWLENQEVIDPTDGLRDIDRECIRMCSLHSFEDDPLRMLRAFRFMAVLQYRIDQVTLLALERQKSEINRSSPERVKYELDLLLSSARSIGAIREMVDAGLYYELFPLFHTLKGCRQPASHHLDVLEHSIFALDCLETIMNDPQRYFEPSRLIEDYLDDARNRLLLKWAALFHDIGKPSTRKDRDGKITFYSHDQQGALFFGKVAEKLRWSKNDSRRVSRLIAGHMWPFHLNNVFRSRPVTSRACLRLAKRFGMDLPGLFLLSMADSLAGSGPEKPAGIEESLARLYRKIEQVYEEHIRQGLTAKPLVNGHDLIRLFKLKPGPQFSEILRSVRDAQICGEIDSRTAALNWVESYLVDNKRIKE